MVFFLNGGICLFITNYGSLLFFLFKHLSLYPPLLLGNFRLKRSVIYKIRSKSMTEKELTEALEKVLDPMHEAHQEFLKTTMDIVHNAFTVGVDVGKALQDKK